MFFLLVTKRLKITEVHAESMYAKKSIRFGTRTENIKTNMEESEKETFVGVPSKVNSIPKFIHSDQFKGNL